MKWSSKRVLITGGAGFIGKNLVKKLLSENAEVTVMDNFSFAPEENLKGLSCNIIKCDVCSLELKNIKDDFDFIFHLAAPSSVILFDKDPLNMYNITIRGFLNIILFAIQKKVRKFIYASSGSTYGRTSTPQSEFMHPQPVNLYGLAKLHCENIATLFKDEVKSVGLRIFAGYGPGEEHKYNTASPITLFLRSIKKGERPIAYGDGSQSRDFVYIDDIVQGLVRSAEVEQTPPIINIGSGTSLTFNDVIQLINLLLCKDVKPVYIPKPKRYLERTMADTTLMKAVLGIIPTKPEMGLRKYISFYPSQSGKSYVL